MLPLYITTTASKFNVKVYDEGDTIYDSNINKLRSNSYNIELYDIPEKYPLSVVISAEHYQTVTLNFNYSYSMSRLQCTLLDYNDEEEEEIVVIFNIANNESINSNITYTL